MSIINLTRKKKSNVEILKTKLRINEKLAILLVAYNNEMKTYIQLAQQAVTEETKIASQKQQWKDFKDSGMYEMLFGDIEKLGNRTIELLLIRLNDLKESLTDLEAPEYKELIQTIEKLKKLKIERKPFKALFSKEELEEYKRVEQEYKRTKVDIGGKKKNLKGRDLAEYQLVESEKQERSLQDQLNLYQRILCFT